MVGNTMQSGWLTPSAAPATWNKPEPATQVAQQGAALAPTLWLLALAALTAVAAKGSSKKGKGK